MTSVQCITSVWLMGRRCALWRYNKFMSKIYPACHDNCSNDFFLPDSTSCNDWGVVRNMTEVNVHGKLPKHDTSENGKEVCTDDVEHTRFLRPSEPWPLSTHRKQWTLKTWMIYPRRQQKTWRLHSMKTVLSTRTLNRRSSVATQKFLQTSYTSQRAEKRDWNPHAWFPAPASSVLVKSWWEVHEVSLTRFKQTLYAASILKIRALWVKGLNHQLLIYIRHWKCELIRFCHKGYLISLSLSVSLEKKRKRSR